MSHNIQYYDYPENVDKEKVFADLANYKIRPRKRTA